MINEFGKFCRKLRKRKKQSMRGMARKLGITVAYQSTFELGKRNITLEILDSIISKYKLSRTDTGRIYQAAERSITKLTFDLAKVDKKERKVLVKAYKRINNIKRSNYLINSKGDIIEKR